MKKRPIYLDYQATTPVDPRVVEAMKPYWNDKFGNAASQDHAWGWTAKTVTEKARTQVAQLLKAQASEIFFTSGATESNNWALLGVLMNLFRTSPGKKIHVITSTIEHKSVSEPLKYLLSWPQELFPLEITWVKPDSTGWIDPEKIKAAQTEHTQLISLHWAHNELSTVQDIQKISEWCHDQKIYFHTDATQAVGKINIDLEKTPIDLLSFSSHKIYGPKGVGALFVRKKNPWVTMDPLIHGGGQEKGQRAGTLNVPGIVGLGQACEILSTDMASENLKYLELRGALIKGLKKIDPELKINTHPDKHLPHSLSVTFSKGNPSLWTESLAYLGVSAGSACHSGEMSGSPNLYQIGLMESQVQKTLRMSLGRWTDLAEIDEILSNFANI